MSELVRLIKQWKETSEENADFRDLFRQCLHKSPYNLKYSVDSKRPELFMCYATDMSDKTNPVVKECNGIILHKDTFEIISYGMRTIIDTTLKNITDDVKTKSSNFVAEEAEDGSVLKIFHYNEEWVVSTNRRIDASRVRWASDKSFSVMLCDALPVKDIVSMYKLFDETLDVGHTYSFILLHPENRLVIKHEKAAVVAVGCRNNETLLEDTEKMSKISWACRPQKLEISDALERLETDDVFNKRGVIFTEKKENGYERFKVDYNWFSKACVLRKNLPTLELSYLACSADEKRMMKKLFGYDELFRYMDNLLRMLGKFSFETYRDSYVRKQYKVVPEHPIHPVMSRLHYIYKTGGEPIRMHHVRDVLDNLPYYQIDAMLWYFTTAGFLPPNQVSFAIAPLNDLNELKESVAAIKNNMRDGHVAPPPTPADEEQEHVKIDESQKNE